MVPLAYSRHRRINGDDESGEPSVPRTFDPCLGGRPSAQKVELIPNRPAGRLFYIFQPVPGDGGESVSRPVFSSSRRRSQLAIAVHQPAVSDGSEDRRK